MENDRKRITKKKLFNVFTNEYRTILDMRFELRMSGVNNIQNFNDKQVVELFNLTFSTYKKGIDINGDVVPYYTHFDFVSSDGSVFSSNGSIFLQSK